MSIEDQRRWDEKHRRDEMPHEPIALVRDYARLAPGKRALDIACGNGRHSKFLATQGFEVDALDISEVAIDSLQNLPHIHAKQVDFDTYTLPKERYDLIVNTYFLHRPLFPQMIDALRPGGIILFETFVHHPDNERPASNPQFRLEEGELEAFFDRYCELLHIREYWDEDYMGYKTYKAQMVAKKRAGESLSDEAFWAS